MSILDEREKTHGQYKDVARVAQNLKTLIRAEPHRLSYEQLESLEMICCKMARIICGNPDEPDHYLDIMGYAELIYRKLQAASGELPKQEPRNDPQDWRTCDCISNWSNALCACPPRECS